MSRTPLADFFSILLDVLAHDLTTMKEDVMHCPACHRAMVSTSSQAFEDEKGAMTITRWRCRPCHETAEEIWLSAGYRGPDPARIRYAVAQPLRQRQIVAPARAAAKRGTHAYAGTI
jgi:transposase-like protein